MELPPLTIDGAWFRDTQGRRIRLRGVNLGGDCKVPYPDGGTENPTDFSDHRDVSFIGRPFPLVEADEHYERLRAWGFNCLRFLTTWEAIEHRGPGDYDTAYLDYLAALVEKAGDYGFYVFIDFHQDVWSRMTGGDGAPGWLFEKVGLDFTKFHAAGATHVMQYKYDYSDPRGRQEDNYPTMTWSQNYRLPANAIMWTLFFAGRDFAPGMLIDGQNVQDYMQGHYLGCQREIARRIAHLPNVLGFDTLNEPGTGWIGAPMSYRHLGPSEHSSQPARPGPAWSPLDGLLVARGIARDVPQLGFVPAEMKILPKGESRVNEAGVSIWLDGATDPFEAAGAYRINGDGSAEVLREDYFQTVDGRTVDHERDYMAPFFRAVADTIRAENPDWLVFAELDPFSGIVGEGFPDGVPERMVNASHWYDIITLATKTFNYPVSFNPLSGETLEGKEAIEASYAKALGRIKQASKSLNDGDAPTLIGEFGIPYDLDQAAAYKAFAEGDRSAEPWSKHVMALDLMYNALDAHHLHSTQWNYTASNRNDQRIGDSWNQEDLSIYSVDQRTTPNDINSGGRALEGFVRPYARATGGTPVETRFDRASGTFHYAFDSDGGGETELYLPSLQYPDGPKIVVDGGACRYDAATQSAVVRAAGSGRVIVTVTR